MLLHIRLLFAGISYFFGYILIIIKLGYFMLTGFQFRAAKSLL